ncbi:stress response protein NST1 isoform X2 [Fagus crenata]
MEVEREKNKPTGKTKRKREKGNDIDTSKAVQSNIEDGSITAIRERKMKESSRKKNRKNEESNTLTGKCEQRSTEAEVEFQDQNGKSKKTKGKRKEDLGPSKKGKEELKKGETDQDEVCHLSPGNEGCSNGMKGSSKKARMKRKKDHNSSKEAEKSREKGQKADSDDVHQISSGDEDCSKGMKKWIMEYHQSRPGLKVLAQNIDDFIVAHEAQLELERKEREAQAAEGGFTVVVHHKGRKKTTEVGSGTTVGSVAKAVVEDKMAKKKGKEVVKTDFYRFQRREAQRNEVMMLQSKFEEDKKRIQQLRAARKFRPY